MKILVRTPDRLVLADAGTSIRAFGTIFAFAGGAVLYSAISNWPNNIPQIIFGPLLLVIGLAFVLLPSRVTASFDRPSHTLVITRHTLRTTTRDEVDLSKVADVVAEQSVSAISRRGPPQATFRVTIVLRDGYRLPLTSWYTSSPSHAEAAAAAREFLGITSQTPTAAAVDSAAGSAAQAFQARRVTGQKFTLAVFVLFSTGFTVLGGWLNYRQYDRMTHYVPTHALVLFSSVSSHRGSKGGMTYSPSVSYRYEVGGREYVSASTTVMQESRSGKWAYDIAARYRANDSTTAYYDPSDPTQSFLYHEYSGLPSIFIAFSLVFVSIAIFLFRRAAKQQGLLSALGERH